MYGAFHILYACNKDIVGVTSKDKKKQKERYSGKKKRHAVKNTIVSDGKTNEIVFLGDTKSGKVHDKKLAEDDEKPYPEGRFIG